MPHRTVHSLDEARLSGLRLGAFILRGRLGVGGMSEVWRAVHEATGVEVAVKLLAPRTQVEVTRERAIEALRHEILLLARLDHPHILRVLEFGTVSAAEAAATQQVLPAGSPYLVTPWARSGSLDRAPPEQSYDGLESMLLSLLGALAHAHARGVVHRDLKPANVLLLGDAERGIRPVLSDFGIAFALARAEDGPEDQLGTPSYMAPEQILGPPLEQGPATDLYALGCLAHRLAAGHAPFVGAADDVLRSHVLIPPPLLAATFAVPEGFAEWIQVLLMKQPHQRFPSAAAARHALVSLRASGRFVEPSSGPIAEARRPDEVMTAPQGRGDRPIEVTRSTVPPLRPSSIDVRRARASLFPRPAPPTTWRVPTAPEPARVSVAPRPSMPDFDLVGAGLGLFGLRRLEVAGRERERDRLYEALLCVHREQRARLVVVRGATGVGTTRLSEWLLETASELDVGTPLRIRADGRPNEAIAELLSRLVGTWGVPAAQVEPRARAWARDAALTAVETADLLALLRSDPRRFDYESERLAAVRRTLGRGATRVPLVVLLDDGVLDPDCVALVKSALAAEDPLPLLFVLTASDDHLDPSTSDGEARARALATLTDASEASEIRLGPLGPDECSALVERLLGLEPGLAQQVVERTEGSPLFVVQLVGDWVHRGLLVPSPAGFALRRGATAEVPDGVFTLFGGRLMEAHDAIAARSSPADADEALIGLELAAVLSPVPLLSEWYAVLDAAGVRAAHALPELAVRGLVRTRRDRFAIGHRLLRESLVRRAREAGRERAHHHIVAEVLTQLDADPSRVAAHHRAAGEEARALRPLLRSAELRAARGDTAGAIAAIRAHTDIVERLGLPADDPRRAEGLMLRAEVVGHLSYFDEASQCLDAVQLGERPAPAVVAKMAWLRGVLAQKRGDAARAIRHFERALGALWPASGLGDAELEARVLYGIGESAKLLGDLDRAEDAYEAVQARCTPESRLMPLALTGLSDLENRRGQTTRALVLGHQALEAHEARGARIDAAITHNALGDIERRRGQLDRAEHHYRLAFTLLTELGSKEADVVRLNLALVAIHAGATDRALVELDAAERAFRQDGRTTYLGFAQVLRLPALAARGEGAVIAAIVSSHRAMLEQIVDPDLLFSLERAVALGASSLDPALAADLSALAAAQRAKLAG